MTHTFSEQNDFHHKYCSYHYESRSTKEYLIFIVGSNPMICLHVIVFYKLYFKTSFLTLQGFKYLTVFDFSFKISTYLFYKILYNFELI